MEPSLKAIKPKTYFTSIPVELIGELEQYRMNELRQKSAKFIKCIWVKDEIEDHIDRGGLIYKNLDTNEQKQTLDKGVPLDNDIINAETSVDRVLKFWLLDIPDSDIRNMMNKNLRRGLLSEFDDYFSLIIKLKSGLYVYINHEYGSGSFNCCHTLDISVSRDLNKLIQEIPEPMMNIKLQDFNIFLHEQK